ncbi:alkaline phosphatase family protein [Alsobacter sp. R-9]
MTGPTKRASRVVVAVFDGLRPDLVREDTTPNILRLAARGAWFREARSIYPSVTRVATASFATGAPPAVHGIVGNAFYHPVAFRSRVLDTSKAADIAAADYAETGSFVTAETLGDQLVRGGRRLAVVHTGSAGSAYMINPRARRNGHWTFSVHGVDHTQTPEAVEEVVARFGPLPERALPRLPDQSYAAKAMVGHVLPIIAADVTVVWFNEPDTSFHYSAISHDNARAALRAADAAFGEILDWVDAQPDADRIAVIAASDHGQITADTQVSLAERAGAAGFRIGQKDRLDGMAHVMTGGRQGEIRSLAGDAAAVEKLARWLMEQPEVSHVFSPAANEIEGIVPGTFAFDVVDAHHPRQPDLGYVLRATNGPDQHGLPGVGAMTPGDVPVGGGMHGGLHANELNTVLVVSHPELAAGLVSDRPCGLIDIAPTILDLLGLPAVSTMRGTSLMTPPRDEANRSTFFVEHRDFTQSVAVVEQDGRRFIVNG